MILTRRNFIKRIGIASGLVLLNPIELIEQVGATFYSFPPAPAPAQSGLLFETMLAVYEQILKDLRRDMNRQLWGDGFNQFAKDTQDRPRGDGYIFNLEYSE